MLVAAIANASFALPRKWMPRWSWENIWSVWSVCSLLVFPFLAAFYTVPTLAVGYHEVAAPVIVRVVVYGFAWGIAQVLFGLSVERIAIALTFSIILGSSAAMGTLLPFIRLHSELLFTGEWRTSTRRPLQLHVAGIALLVLALFLLSRVNA